MTLWEFMIASGCVGVACFLLNPHEPESAIASVLFIVGLWLVAWKP